MADLQVVQALTISQAEVTRGNIALAQLAGVIAQRDTALVEVQRLSADVTRLTAEVSRLTALLAQQPGPTGPTGPGPTGSTGPVGPLPSRSGLYVDGMALRSKTGADVAWRGMELMWGPTSDANARRLCQNIKAFGANAISPLFQAGQDNAQDVRECLVAARAEGLLVGVNADHSAGGTSWIKRSDIVQLCNEADHVMLESEVELGSIDAMTLDQWKQNAKTFITNMRAVGHKAPIKVGSPTGGRLPQYALRAGAELVAHDPEHSLIFTWQAYWPSTTQGWQFTRDRGWDTLLGPNPGNLGGTAAALAVVEAIKTSGLCFIVGLDGADDIGVTPYVELASRCHQNGIGWQWWAWMVGDAYGNGVMSDTMGTNPKQPFGPVVRDILRAQAKLAAL